ncbi:MAG: hypothetical protein ACI8QC_000468 [Planctomycetota bacterium]|jgi:hypothetical protein
MAGLLGAAGILGANLLSSPVQALAAPNGTGVGSNYCGPAELNSAGLSATIAGIGSDLVSSNSFALSASDLPNFKLGYFLLSTTTGFVPMAGGSMGNLCLGGQITRLNGSVLNSGFSGSFALALDLGQMPDPAGQILPGETWHFQAWYRDLVQVNTSNFTDGLTVHFQ